MARIAAPASKPGLLTGSRVRSVPVEVVGYAVLATGLAVLLWSRIGDVDGFYLDEWFYAHGSEYIWDHFPASLTAEIPFWDRGPQRLYSTLLAPLWGALPASTGYTWAHVLNVVLLVSAIVPAALFARLVIDSAALRVLAVGLATAVPWLTIGSHLLTENLAFPLYMWSLYAIVRCAEEPSVWRQAGALAAVVALGLCRLNLAIVIAVLFVAVAVAEGMRRRAEREVALGGWLRSALRRELVVVVAAVVAGAAGVALAVRGGSGVSSHYGGLDFDSSIERLFGAAAGETWRTMATYVRGLVVGSFVFPFAIGCGVAFAGVAGRLGRRFVIPSLVALLGAVVVVMVVATSTVGGAIEERYVMYVYSPVAVLAVAGLANLDRARYWLIPGSAFAVFLLAEGAAPAAMNSGHFFAAPAGAFWSRGVQHRLFSWEEDLLGWLSIDAKGWLLVAAALLVMCAVVALAVSRGRTAAVVPVLAGGLALCAVAQVLVMNYDFGKELYGTPEAPGGIALSPGHDADRDTWLDDRGRPGSGVAVMPGLVSGSAPWGGTEALQFWNRALDTTVSVYWNGTVVPAPPGYSVVETRLRPDGLAEWLTRPTWLAAHEDDPRVQFPGTLVASSPLTRYGLYRTRDAERALWTSAGLQADGAVVKGTPVDMTLDRAAAGGASAVTITLRAAGGATEPVRWRVTRDGRAVAQGRLRPNTSREVPLRVPACDGRERCAPVRWELRASGPAVPIPLPVFGAPGEPRPVVLQLDAAHVRSPQ
jgi:hypothetical protein